MATNTEFLGLKKPAQNDFYNIDDINENFQKIDDFVKNLDDVDLPTTGGGAVGQEASTSSGGAVGYQATTYGGAAIGESATSTSGAAIGYKTTTTSGGAVGKNTTSTGGGSIGEEASTSLGGAVGAAVKSEYGGAVGYRATSTGGGAVGSGAVTGDGFAGGLDAKTMYNNNKIDAIQLGTGTNTIERTLQVYGYQLMTANGKVPNERLPIQSGSYVGTGTFGANNKTSLTFGFTPKIVFISPTTPLVATSETHYFVSLAFIYGCDTAFNSYSTASRESSYNIPLHLTWSANTLSFYYGKSATTSTAAANQFNHSGVTYNYVAIG